MVFLSEYNFTFYEINRNLLENVSLRFNHLKFKQIINMSITFYKQSEEYYIIFDRSV